MNKKLDLSKMSVSQMLSLLVLIAITTLLGKLVFLLPIGYALYQLSIGVDPSQIGWIAFKNFILLGVSYLILAVITRVTALWYLSNAK